MCDMTSSVFSISRLLGSQNKRTSDIKQNALYSILIKGISIVSSLLMVPLTLDFLSQELYGIWLTLSSLMWMLSFLDIGFTSGLKNRLAEALAYGDVKKGQSLVSTTYFAMIVIFIPLYLLLIPVIHSVEWASILNVDYRYSNDIKMAMYILAATFCLQMVINVISAVVSAFQKVALSNSFPVIGQVLSLLVMYILVKTCNPSLFLLSTSISVIPLIVMTIASVILFSGRYNIVAPSFASVKIENVKSLLGLGFNFFLIQVQFVILYQATNFIISTISGPQDVVSYNIAYKYFSVATMFFTILVQPLWPAFTDAKSKNDYVWMNSVYRKMLIVYALLVLGLIAMFLGSHLVYSIWIGDSVLVPISMSILLMVYMIINAFVGLHANIINGIGCVKLQTYVTFIGLVMHIPLSLLFGNFFGMESRGVVLSMIVINAIYSITFFVQIRKLLSNKATGIWVK